MSGTQLLRLLVNERLTAAAEEIFGLVEKTIAEYEDEAVRSKREIIQLRQHIEQLTVLKPEVTLFRAEELLPSLQQDDVKVEEIQENPEVKEEQVDQSIVTDVEADISNAGEVRHPESEPAINCELLPSSTAETVSENESIDDKLDAEVSVELDQPQREEKCCRFCGNIFTRYSDLIRHVAESHKGHKAFKCLECNKEFEKRSYLMLHTRTHTGEKPFNCGFCDKTFIQRSTCLAHMRTHTGEKPYFCNKCGKSFAWSNHFKLCKLTPEKGNADEDPREEKAFKCFECNKEFKRKTHLVQHTRVHTGEKPFGCDHCNKTFTQKVACVVHMRTHTGEKPYLCKKCGKSFTTGRHAKKCTGTQNKNTNKKSFCCTTCGRSFHTESDLKVHMEVHESWRRHISEKQGLGLGEKICELR